ncbi:MAG: decaprenyl-phosphate phosphoribosyltransferase [Nocardioidaceae bacterium]
MTTSTTSASISTGAVVRAARPRQWVKNLLVLAAPTLGGRIGDVDVLVAACIAFVAFCLAASGIYFINDVRDIAEDRAHPTKRFRAIAAGEVSTRLAVGIGVSLLLLGLAISLAANWQLFAVIATYEAVSITYCLALKDEPVLDIAIIASGFLLRAVAGGAAAGIDLSQWFLLAASFGSLFMAAGKRYSEVLMVETGNTSTRRSLSGYSASYLRFVWSVAAAILIMTYGLWAFEIREVAGTPWAAISIAPFVLAVLRYAVDVDAGRAGAPEEIALSDRVLQALAVVWLTLVAIAVYLD